MEFQQKIFWISGSLLGFLAILAGAFGSHVLKQRLAPESLNVFEVAVRYQMYHALVLVILAISIKMWPSNLLVWAGWCFMIGTLIFSGSLYLLVFSAVKKWGAVTPIGGVILLFGWLLSLLAAFFL